jgi:hypothetical protein
MITLALTIAVGVTLGIVLIPVIALLFLPTIGAIIGGAVCLYTGHSVINGLVWGAILGAITTGLAVSER